jgi:hypothetical protein
MGWQGKPVGVVRRPPGAIPVEPLASLPVDRQPLELPEDFGVGWEVFEVCPIEHQGDPARRGGIAIGWSATHVVVVRPRIRGRDVDLRQQAIPRENLDPARVERPDRRRCHSAARLILASIAGGRGDLTDDDRMWVRIAIELAEVGP